MLAVHPLHGHVLKQPLLLIDTPIGFSRLFRWIFSDRLNSSSKKHRSVWRAYGRILVLRLSRSSIRPVAATTSSEFHFLFCIQPLVEKATTIMNHHNRDTLLWGIVRPVSRNCEDTYGRCLMFVLLGHHAFADYYNSSCVETITHRERNTRGSSAI